jgi:hypothetical protein
MVLIFGGIWKEYKKCKTFVLVEKLKNKLKKVITLLYNDSTFGGKQSTKALENILNYKLFGQE